MKHFLKRFTPCVALILFFVAGFAQSNNEMYGDARLLNQEDDGFRGIWYMISSPNNEYKLKYGGGLGTYPANHYPFSVYVAEVNKTFFCYGGTDETNSTLFHQVSYFDHNTGKVARPTIVLDKATDNAHDNPVMQVDKDGYIWIFSTAHGVQRPAFIHRSVTPYNIKEFEHIPATKIVDVEDHEYADGYYARWAVEQIQKLKDSEEPFFLGVGFYKPHLPFNAPRKYWER